MSESRHSTAVLLAFAGPGLVIQLIGFPVLMILPTFYAQHAAVSLVTVGVILGTTRLVDAFVDPLIGYLSDRTRSRWGQRKPWLVAAAMLGSVGIYYLFSPSPTADATYFLCWTLVVNFAWSCFNVPHNAWASELSRDYRERSRTFYYKGLTGAIGTLAFLSLPLLPFFKSNAIGPELIHTIALIGIILFPAVLLVCVTAVPRGATGAAMRVDLRALWWSLRNSRPIAIFLAIYCMGGIASGFSIALTYLFIQHYLKIGSSYPIIMGTWALMHFIGMPIWLQIIYRLGKPRALSVSWALASLVVLPIVFITPGDGAIIPMTVIFFLRGLLSAAELVVPAALYGDVIDYDSLRSKRNQAGTLYAVMGLLVKGCVAVGSSIGLVSIAAFGYSLASTDAPTAMAELGLKLMYVVIPALLYLVASALMWRFPIGPKEHDVIRRGIERQQKRAAPSAEGPLNSDIFANQPIR